MIIVPEVSTAVEQGAVGRVWVVSYTLAGELSQGGPQGDGGDQHG